jgi:hypothetical protein
MSNQNPLSGVTLPFRDGRLQAYVFLSPTKQLAGLLDQYCLTCLVQSLSQDDSISSVEELVSKAKKVLSLIKENNT